MNKYRLIFYPYSICKRHRKPENCSLWPSHLAYLPAAVFHLQVDLARDLSPWLFVSIHPGKGHTVQTMAAKGVTFSLWRIIFDQEFPKPSELQLTVPPSAMYKLTPSFPKLEYSFRVISSLTFLNTGFWQWCFGWFPFRYLSKHKGSHKT